jgi:hypothetical protein
MVPQGPVNPSPSTSWASGGQVTPATLEALRVSDFSRLAGRVYADYAGAPPYSEAHVRSCAEELATPGEPLVFVGRVF